MRDVCSLAFKSASDSWVRFDKRWKTGGNSHSDDLENPGSVFFVLYLPMSETGGEHQAGAVSPWGF